jgi:cytidylate kinase
MFRAAALKCLREGVELDDEQSVMRTVASADIEVDCGPTHTRVLLDGHDVSEAVRGMEVNQATPLVSRNPEVRRMMVDSQRAIGRRLGSLVTEGRDQGTVVFPDADLKFLLDATLESRAERRFHELRAEGLRVNCADVQDNLKRRDGNDQRHWAALLVPGAAVLIDTTDKSILEVVDLMYQQVLTLQGKRVPTLIDRP